MNTKTDKITITERAILELVRYKTRNNYIFFGGNDYIASAMDIKKDSAKVLVNNLIRKGFLNRTYDKHHRRVLSLTDKPYLRLFDDMSGVDKKVITMERDDALRDSLYYQREYNGAELRIEQLINEKTELVCANTALQQRIYALENIFYKNGVTKEQLEALVNA